MLYGINKRSSGLILTKPFMILNTSMRSPLSYLISNGLHFSFLSRTKYGYFLNLGSNFIALL